MASIRDAALESRTARLKLPKRRRPYWVALARGLSLGYRRINTAGPWIVRSSDGKGGNRIQNFAVADDHEQSDGDRVLTFWEAQTAARAIASGGKVMGGPLTVAGAIERYGDELRANSGNPYNARLAGIHLPAALLSKPVQLLTTGELRQWRNSLQAGRAASTVNRIVVTLSAALTLAAEMDQRITNRAWKVGLQKLKGANTDNARNTVLAESSIRELVGFAYKESPEFGLLIETMATTGARRVQLARLVVRDLQDDRSNPRLMMPSALKGKKVKRVDRHAVAIPASLAAKLRKAADGRTPESLLLRKPDGAAWAACDPYLPFHRTVTKAGLDPKTVTAYALRHSSITRQLIAGIPVRIVAAAHDTSVDMVEKTYSAYIAEHSDALFRRSLFEMDTPPPDNVVAIRK